MAPLTQVVGVWKHSDEGGAVTSLALVRIAMQLVLCHRGLCLRNSRAQARGLALLLLHLLVGTR